MDPSPNPPAARTDRHEDRGPTDEVVAWCEGVELDALPDDVLEVARHCFLDWLTVTVAGSSEPLTDILAEDVEAGTQGPATLIGRDQRARVIDAALVNGAASHALDYDDVHLAMPGHPSAPVFAALVPIAEATGLDGASFLRAAICGLEAELRIALAAQPDHYERGWHATATIGTIGAAIACAEALGATAEQRRHAIGLAVSRVAGVKSMFGTMTKPTQVGAAAANGASAARLAVRGMTAHPHALEDPQGLLPLYSSWDGSWEPWADQPFLVRDTLFKYHAACYFTHAGIDAATELRAQIGTSPVASLRVRSNPGNLSVCDIRRPSSGLESKFSMTATTALALLGQDTSAPTTFTDEMTRDSALRHWIDRTSVEADTSLERTQMVLTAELEDGTVITTDADSGRPESDLARQRARLQEKCRRLATGTLPATAVETLLTQVDATERLGDLRELLAAASGSTG